jgi:hypothetical protein
MGKRGAALFALLALGGGAAAWTSGAGAPAPAAAETGPAIGPAQAREIALVRAAAAGDAEPAVAVEADSNARAATAMAAPQGAALAEPPGGVYVVTMRGRFTLGQAHVPPGMAAPTGSVLKVAVDRTGFVVGLHLGDI